MYRMSEVSTKKPSSGITALIIICITFIVPLALWFSVAYSASGGLINSFLLFLGIYGFAFLITLMYYRMAIQDEMEAKIDKINSKKVKSIAATTLASFSLVLITIFVLAVNPELVTIFENTIGIWFLGITGNRYFANEVFHSETFSELIKNTEDKSVFDQSFLLTRFSNDNIDDFINKIKEKCSDGSNGKMSEDYPFDFKPDFKNQGQITKLRELVSTKHLVGYFSWIYFTSILSLIISIISVTMKTM
jgi:hypothetical protein